MCQGGSHLVIRFRHYVGGGGSARISAPQNSCWNRIFASVIILPSQRHFSYKWGAKFGGTKIVMPFWMIGWVWLAYVANVIVWRAWGFGATKIAPPRNL